MPRGFKTDAALVARKTQAAMRSASKSAAKSAACPHNNVTAIPIDKTNFLPKCEDCGGHGPWGPEDDIWNDGRTYPWRARRE